MIFITEDANFEFNREAVMELLEHRKLSYEIRELDTLIDLLSNQLNQIILSSAEHPYFGHLAIDLIDAVAKGPLSVKIAANNTVSINSKLLPWDQTKPHLKPPHQRKEGLNACFEKSQNRLEST